MAPLQVRRDDLEAQLRRVEEERRELLGVDEQLARLAPPPPVEEVPWHFPGSDLRRAREAEAAYATEVDRATAELGPRPRRPGSRYR
ncbi:MAG: hypothetical protein M3P70_04060 [Actinomycetota bacterium]|nr:hypothetical protein [Actinomycetota bacterium]